MSQKEYVVKYRKPAKLNITGEICEPTDTQVFTNVHDFKEFIGSLQSDQIIEMYERVELDYNDFMKDTLYHLTYQINSLTTDLSQTLTKSFKTFEELSKFFDSISNKHTILSVDLPKSAEWIKEFKRIS